METFGFLIHPMDIEDVAKKYKIAKKISPKVIAGVLKHRRPFVVSEITGVRSLTGKEATGWFIVVPFLPHQFSDLEEDYVVEKIGKACEVGRKEGAKIIGLGAFTAIPGDGGREVAKLTSVPITTGNTYTIATAIEGTMEAARKMRIDVASSTLAIVGATGSIGSACADVLASQVSDLVLIGRDSNRLSKLKEKLGHKARQVTVSTSLSAIRTADLIITVTGAADSIIEPGDIKTGAVVCDVARPRDVSELVVKRRNDVLVIDGGIVQVPGPVDFHFNFGLPRRMAWACLAETMMLALEGRYENYTIGKEISVEKVNETMAFAKKHGFKLAGLRSFEKKLTDAYINKVRENTRLRLTAAR
ncbi:MAG TPA: polysaccharide biosynthesis protein [Anaerolineae bacterium]|nr:polysaccharide biosynthesis protein [Anaerolineae bacterium]